MKVGEYVRTKDGYISKITDNFCTSMKIATNKGKHIYDYIDIRKSSPNIIDLIEVGDYVNGTIVTKVVLDNIECNYIELDYSYNKRGIRNKDIKSIVTHEQFSQMEYRMGELLYESNRVETYKRL